MSQRATNNAVFSYYDRRGKMITLVHMNETVKTTITWRCLFYVCANVERVNNFYLIITNLNFGFVTTVALQ